MVKYVIFGNKKINAYLMSLSRNVVRTAMDAIAKYIVGSRQARPVAR